MADPRNPNNFEEDCPYCSTRCWCDLVHNGIGFVQCGPYRCNSCGAVEAGPYDDKPDDLARIDPKTGWFPPNSQPGSSANMVDGKLATAKETEAAYKAQFSNNPLYHVKGIVEDWFKRQREIK